MAKQKSPNLCIDRDTFFKVIAGMQITSRDEGKAYDLGVDLLTFTEQYNNIIHHLLQSIFNEEQMGWIEWFLYERPSLKGEDNKAWKTLEDGTKVKICNNIDSLWEEIQNIETKNIAECLAEDFKIAEYYKEMAINGEI